MRPSLVQHTSLPTARLEPVTQPDTTCGLASQSPPVSPEADCPSHCSSVSKEAVCCQDGEPAAAAEGLALLPAVTLDCKTETTAPADSPLTETASPKGPSTPTKLSEATCRAAPVTPASSKPADNSLPAGIKTTMSNVRYLSQKFERQELDQTGIQRADIDSEIVGLAPIDNSANGGAMSYNRAASGVARSEMNVKNSGKSAKLTPPAADSLAQVSADIRGLKVVSHCHRLAQRCIATPGMLIISQWPTAGDRLLQMQPLMQSLHTVWGLSLLIKLCVWNRRLVYSKHQVLTGPPPPPPSPGFVCHTCRSSWTVLPPLLSRWMNC